MMHLLITRPRPDSEKFKVRLEQDNRFEVSLAPLLAIEPDHSAVIPERQWQAVLVTSANALSSLGTIGIPAGLTNTQIMAVGPATASLAREFDFTKVEQANGDVTSLAALCRDRLSPDAGPLLYLTGKQRSGDLAADLARNGFEITRIELYDAVPAAKLAAEVVTSIKDGTINAVALYSPRTAQIWAQLVAKHDLQEAASRMMHFCLSTAVATKLTDKLVKDATKTVASRPDDDAMIAAIHDFAEEHGSINTSPGETVDMANRKRTTRKAGKSPRPTVIDADAVEVPSHAADAAKPEEATAREADREQLDAANPVKTTKTGAANNQSSKSAETPKSKPDSQTAGKKKAGSSRNLVTTAIVAALLAGAAGGSYLYRSYGDKIFGSTEAAANIGAIEGQAIEAIGAAQSASESASSALTQVKGLSDKVAAIEQKIEAQPVSIGLDEKAAATLSEAAELAGAARTGVEELSARTDKIENDLTLARQSVDNLRGALETASANGGGVDQAEFSLKLKELTDRINSIEQTQADKTVTGQDQGLVEQITSLKQQLENTGKHVEELETKLSNLSEVTRSASPSADSVAQANVAVAALDAAVANGNPFEDQLKKLEVILGGPIDLPALTTNAALGVPTIEQLTNSLNNVSVADDNSPSPTETAPGFWSTISGKLTSVVKIRKVSEGGDWADRIEAARTAMAASNIDTAIAALGASPATETPQSLVDWLSDARRHLETRKALQLLPQIIFSRVPAANQ